MRLTSVTADNVLSMQHASVEPGDGLTAIVGPNGAGKTNVIRVITLAGLALEWLEERSTSGPGPAMTQPARSAMAAYAASRCRSSHPETTMHVEVGLNLGKEDVEELVVFMRAAFVSTLMATGNAQHGPQLAEWAARHITPQSIADLSRGALVLMHAGSADAPWEVSWEFESAGQRCRWGLSDLGGGRVSAKDTAPGVSRTADTRYVQLWEAVFGQLAGGRQELPELTEFDFSLLLRKDGTPVEAPMVHASGGRLDPELAPHRAFAELAEAALWIQQPNRVCSLAWVLRRAFQRGIVFIGEQLRGVGTMAVPPRPAGRYSISELASRAPGLEPYALPLRLMRLKNGSLQERDRFHRIQGLFGNLASGRGVELSFQVVQGNGENSDAEAAVTVLVTEHDASGSPFELPVQLCGAGTWEALVLSEALASPDRVMIMDEPALNLHPGWQQHMLRAQGRQASPENNR